MIEERVMGGSANGVPPRLVRVFVCGCGSGFD